MRDAHGFSLFSRITHHASRFTFSFVLGADSGRLKLAMNLTRIQLSAAN
jgi:hypothetical protein